MAGVVIFRISFGTVETLLVQNWKGRWSFPKGKVRLGESLEDAAVRETMEETGILPLGLQWVVSFQPRPDHTHHFWSTNHFVSLGNAPGRDIQDVRWVTPQDAELSLRPWMHEIFKHAAMQHEGTVVA